MRWLLLLIIVSFPVALASPTFWHLLAMEVSVAPVSYVRHDGTVQQALLGPKAPWADWATRPDGAALTIKAWFGPTPYEPETGYADLTYGGQVPGFVAAYVAKLEAEGWKVETRMLRTLLPWLPGKRLEECVLRASRGDGDSRVLQASFGLIPYPGTGRLHWATRTTPGWRLPDGEAC